MFCPAAIQPSTSVYSVFCVVNAIYTANTAKQHTGLYRGFFWDLSHSTATNTRPAQADIMPPVPRWDVSQRRSTSSAYQIPDATPGRCTGQHNRPIIIRYIRGCSISQTMQARRGLLQPCVDRWQVLTRCQQYRPGAPAEGSASPPVQGQPGGCLDTSNARRLAIWHRSAVRAHRLAPSTRRGSPAAGARRAERNHWRLSPQLFSGFRPIANRGQQ